MSEDQVSLLASALDGLSSAVTAQREDGRDDGPWRVEWIVAAKPGPADLTARLCLRAELGGIHPFPLSVKDWSIEAVPDTDWLAASYKGFPPFAVGPFFIHGSHYDGAVPEGQMGLQIDAATAFGSGEHGTTKGCLQALLDLKGRGACPWNVLDMGTGSGILAIAAWKLWKTPVLAVDIEDESVRQACRHREANAVPAGGTGMLCKHGDGFKAEIVQEKKPFDLIIANILAGPLIEMAPDLAAVLDDNGMVILSGMLKDQAADVLRAYEKLGLSLRDRYDIGEWSTLLLRHAAA